MVNRRTLLAASTGVLLPGCLLDSQATSGSCEDLEPASSAAEDRITDLIVHNARSTTARVDLAVDGPETRRCDTFELGPEADRLYPAILEDGRRYELRIEVDGETRDDRSWGRSNFGNVGMLAEVEAAGVTFREFQH